MARVVRQVFFDPTGRRFDGSALCEVSVSRNLFIPIGTRTRDIMRAAGLNRDALK